LVCVWELIAANRRQRVAAKMRVRACARVRIDASHDRLDACFLACPVRACMHASVSGTHWHALYSCSKGHPSGHGKFRCCVRFDRVILSLIEREASGNMSLNVMFGVVTRCCEEKEASHEYSAVSRQMMASIEGHGGKRKRETCALGAA
jgi:hypothetical protein